MAPMRKFLFVFAVFSLVAVFIAACGGSSGGTGGTGTTSSNTVHMNDTNFVQPAITIKKGESVNLVDDVAVVHIIQNGTWNNGVAEPRQEPGAPTVQQNFQGNDQHPIGPFNTAGVFHVYCTVHPGMNLAITVQ
ncbi:MAG TPA: plastocyanin/azurin family copper-binding protein [Ktedonobacteraceae bacterium]|nr:plastocyanin/azurin family copper-binding protein [Ktedonobacteraceae bacterium]